MQKIQHLYFLIFHLQRQPNLPGGIRRKADRASILQLDPISQIRNIADVVGVKTFKAGQAIVSLLFLLVFNP